jgi:hypothetical protein
MKRQGRGGGLDLVLRDATFPGNCPGNEQNIYTEIEVHEIRVCRAVKAGCLPLDLMQKAYKVGSATQGRGYKHAQTCHCSLSGSLKSAAD